MLSTILRHLQGSRHALVYLLTPPLITGSDGSDLKGTVPFVRHSRSGAYLCQLIQTNLVKQMTKRLKNC